MNKTIKLYILPIAALLAFASAPRCAVSQTGPDPKPIEPVPPPKLPNPPIPPVNPNSVSTGDLLKTILMTSGLS